jgi:hypothetical protein
VNAAKPNPPASFQQGIRGMKFNRVIGTAEKSLRGTERCCSQSPAMTDRFGKNSNEEENSICQEEAFAK